MARERRYHDWDISNRMLEQTIADIKRKKKVDRSFEIPYTAGYSLDGQTLYIDRYMPRGFKWKGKVYLTDDLLLLHEDTENDLIHGSGLEYLDGHQIALRAEFALCAARNIPWSIYNDRFMMPWVTKIGERKIYKHCPPQLNLKPYIDENDADTLRRMGLDPDKLLGDGA